MDAKTKPRLVFSLLFLCLYLKTHVSLAADTITANQSLSGYQTIVSAGGVFGLGFFKPGNSSNFYIGVWYSMQVAYERTIVWVANRESPVSDRFSSVLRISDGNLVLFNESKTPVWSTNVASTSASASLEIEANLLDNGNLVLRAGSSTSTTSEPLWQSFDHPAHTWLPGSRIGLNKITKQSMSLTSWKNSEDPAPGLFSLELDPIGINSLIIMRNKSNQYWTSGSWDISSRTFQLDPEMTLDNVTNYSYVTNGNESYFTYSLYNSKNTSLLVMSMSGQAQQLTWLEPSKQWILFWSKPKVYAFCGPFSSYNETSLPFCNCLIGFEPKSLREWNLRDYSGGCLRKTSLQCGNAANGNGREDQFLEMPSMSLPENKQSVEGGSIAECKSICFKNCTCTAYAYGSMTGCSIWTEDHLGLQQLAADDADGKTLYMQLLS